MGTLLCFDAKNGKVLWSKSLVKDFGGRLQGWDYAPSPVIDGERLILVPGAPQGAVLVLNKNTGETIWQGGGDNVAGYSTPVIATINGTKQYVVFLGKMIAGINPETGAMIWSYPWNTSFDCNAATPLVIGNSVFITSGYGHGCAMIDVNGANATQRWFNKEMQAQFSSPVLFKDHIYGTGDPGFLMCLDPATGKALWKQNGFEKGGIVALDGVIIALNGSNGDMIMAELTPTAYKEVGRAPGLGAKSWTAPIIGEGRIIARDVRSLACLELK
jgi:outer membrane protein assembly factor BamB